jgi:tol-pal system protein YbgF
MKSAGKRTGAVTSSSLASRTHLPLRPRPSAAILICLPLVAGCATRADLLQVQQELRETQARIADQQVAIDGVRRRLDILRNDIGESGRGGHGGGSAQLQQRMTALDARLTALEDHQAGGASTPLANATPTPAAMGAVDVPHFPETPPTPRVATPLELALIKEEASLGDARVEPDYREALQLIKDNKCTQAVPKLRDFIRRNSKSNEADNAQYWIGACYYEQRDYSRSIIELNDLVLKYQKGDKVPAALLMMADAFADSGDEIDARLVLQKLISQYGTSPEAEQARQKLQSLSK